MGSFLSLRTLTALVVIGLALHAVSMGARLVPFAIAEMNYGEAEDRVSQLREWRDLVGVAAAAREPSPVTSQKPKNLEQLVQARTDLEAYLAMRPLSPVKWLALAEVDLSTGKPTADAIHALDMSHLTGPNEGYVMPRRALFGVLLWESLDQRQRFRVGRDIALADNLEEQRMRNLVKLKSTATKENIKFVLLQLEGLTAGRLASLGLN